MARMVEKCASQLTKRSDMVNILIKSSSFEKSQPICFLSLLICMQAYIVFAKYLVFRQLLLFII
jgi:hypothetical protein